MNNQKPVGPMMSDHTDIFFLVELNFFPSLVSTQ